MMVTSPKCLVDAYGTEAAWLAARRLGVTATEAAVACGANPWKSRFTLWSEKVGLIEPPDISDKPAVRWGNRLQQAVAEGYAEETGREVITEPRFCIRRSADHDWMLASLDAWQGTPERPTAAPLEIKTTGASHGKEWDDEPPLHYQIQLQHQLAVTGSDWGTLCCLIGGQKLKWFDCERNDKFIARMLEQEAAFWDLVQRQVPPEVDGSEATAEALKRLYPADNGESIMLPVEFANHDVRLCELKDQIKRLEEERRLIENQLKASIGEATIGILADGTCYTHKLQTNKYPAKEAHEISFRVLRRKGVK